MINEHGNRRVTRLERTGKPTVLADWYDGEGKSLYLSASAGLYRLRVNATGIRPGAVRQEAA